MRNQLTEQPDLLSKIEWRDEACFKLSGHANRHNYWVEENPHVIMTTQLNHPGITQCGVAYPVMVLWDGVVGVFQQDEFPPHYSLDVHQYLKQAFSHLWMERRGSIKWPPHSPDLTPIDFFF
ncbi:putative mariner [Trichonephila clavipes]|nr:putative mariner [Trichonephila clavipes]